MKGFIEVHYAKTGGPFLVNVKAIIYVTTVLITYGIDGREERTTIRVAYRGDYIKDIEVSELYEQVKHMIEEAYTPAHSFVEEEE